MALQFNSMEFFGKDLQMEILSKLPVKSLLRLRCVCKSWGALIKSAYFVSKHLQYNRATFKKDGNLPLFFTAKPDVTPKVSWFAPNNIAATLDPAAFSFFRDLKPFKKILGPVNGLYVIVWRCNDYVDDVVLCNPALREFKALPEIPCLMTGKAYGFGYDLINKDFKVVVFSKSCCPRLARSDYNPVFVYSLNSNSIEWRVIDFNSSNFSQLFKRKTSDGLISKPFFVSYIDGVAHWLVGTACILSFNFHDEVFRWFNIPVSKGARLPHLAVLNGKIVVYYMNNKRKFVWAAWAMKYGNDRSWTRLHDEMYCLLRFRDGFWKNNAEVVFYKLKKLKTIHKPPGFKHGGITYFNQGQVCAYMESLVSVNGDSGILPVE